MACCRAWCRLQTVSSTLNVVQKDACDVRGVVYAEVSLMYGVTRIFFHVWGMLEQGVFDVWCIIEQGVFFR